MRQSSICSVGIGWWWSRGAPSAHRTHLLARACTHKWSTRNNIIVDTVHHTFFFGRSHPPHLSPSACPVSATALFQFTIGQSALAGAHKYMGCRVRYTEFKLKLSNNNTFKRISCLFTFLRARVCVTAFFVHSLVCVYVIPRFIE